MSVINTNYLALVSQNNLTKSQNALGTAIERLSSGLRINSAKDDAAGQAIANRFTANINGLTQAARNANDGISIAQTTEGSLNEINENLQRIRVLTNQAVNGTNSSSDLDSIQDEINQRLAEINRVSEQTQFNGVRVLAGDQSLKIQVGANDSETITVNLKEITAKTLGLDGFSINGEGETQNRTATVSDLLAAKGVLTGSDYKVTTTHAAVTAAQAFEKIKDGDSLTIGTATTKVYTYDGEAGNFTFDDTVLTKTIATAIVPNVTPASGTTTGVLELSAGKTSTFEVDATGKVTIDGVAAFITTEGQLTTNSGTGTTAATITNVLTTAAGKQGSVTIGGTTYKGNAAGTGLEFKNTISKDTLLTQFTAGAAGSKIKLSDGVLSAELTFTTGKSTSHWVDGAGDFTTVQTYDVTYAVDPDSGNVTVKAASTNAGKYAPEVGSKMYVSSSGQLTTSETSKGEQTVDPLAALDTALATVDAMRSELGAVQNRFQSTIANLNNTVTNLSAARSRIQDADYAVEVSNMTRAQILQQAGTSVLAQANQVPQGVLSLLR